MQKYVTGKTLSPKTTRPYDVKPAEYVGRHLRKCLPRFNICSNVKLRMGLTEPLFRQDWLSCVPGWWGIARFNKKTVLFYNVYRKAKRIIARDTCQFPCKITDIYVKRSFAGLFCTGRVANKTNGMQPVFWDAATQRQYINLENNVNRRALYSSTCYLVVIDECVTSVDSWAANTFEPIASDNKKTQNDYKKTRKMVSTPFATSTSVTTKALPLPQQQVMHV